MHRFNEGLLLLRIGLANVFLAQRLLLLVARPADEILAIAGHDRRRADQRTGELGAIGTGVKEVPAALIGWILLGAARRYRTPVGHLQIDVDADFLEAVG